MPYSAALVYLLFGAVLAVLLGCSTWRIEPLEDALVIQHVASAVIVLALFATGIRLDRELAWAEWGL